MADARGQPKGRWCDPRWNYPEYPPGSVIEIRVHGVGGEPPSAMTRDPDPVLVGGDELAGFYRARNPVVGTVEVPGADEQATSSGNGQTASGNGQPSSDEEQPAAGNGQPPSGNGQQPRMRRALHVREVLAWGGQTSGTVRHALWVLLLPFAMFNVAGRMHRTASPRRGAWQRAVCRVLALTLTLAVVALTSGIVFDLIAVQCGAHGQACLGGEGSGRWLLAPFRAFDEDVIGRFGIAALVPLLVIVAFWYSGRYGSRSLEARGEPVEERLRTARHEPTSLADADFWLNAWPASRLRGLHATAGFAWSAGTLALSSHLVLLDTAAPGEGVTAAWLVLAAFSALTVLACVLMVALPRTAFPGPSTGQHVVETLLRGIGLGGLGLGVGAALLGRLLLPSEDAVRESVGFPLLSLLCLLAGVVALALWAFGTQGPPWNLTLGPRSAFAIQGADGQPNVSISGANIGLLLGSVLIGAAATSGRPGAVVREAYLEPSTAELAGLPATIHGPDGILPGLFPGPYLPLLGLFALQVTLVGLLAILSAWPPWGDPPRDGGSGLGDSPPIALHQAPVVLALLATLLVTAVGAGLHRLLVDAFGSHVVAGDLADTELTLPLVTPWWYGLTALVVLALPLVGVAVWGLLALRARPARPTHDEVRDHLAPAYEAAGLAPPGRSKEDEARLDEVAKGWMTQRLLRDAGPLLGWTVGLVSTGVVAAFAWLWFREGRFSTAIPLVSLAAWVVIVIPPAAVALIRSSLSDRGRRREVGRLWDVLTFWPRVTHPFAPPCYGEALVPMLTDRVDRLLDATAPATASSGDDAAAEPLGYRVILAGHSQGSVVSLAVAARLEAGERTDGSSRSTDRSVPSVGAMRRVALVSYGSPIALLYERYFRATLSFSETEDEETDDESVYHRAERAVHSWHHLFGLTEPFAFPFWRIPPAAGADDDPPRPDAPADHVWWQTRRLPRADEPCPACDGAPDAPRRCCVELLVRDPDRWTLWDDCAVVPLGHSVYHRHPVIDEHLGRIARSLVAAGGATPCHVLERRAEGWWRVGV